MYKQDQPKIAYWARSGPDNLARVIQFAMISAREKFFNVPALIEEARNNDPGTLFGWKMRAYHEAWERREEVFHHLTDIYQSDMPRRVKADAMLAVLCDLHGLGAVKSGFVLQLAFGLSGCLDTVNVERLGLKLPGFRIGGAKSKLTRRRLASFYNGLVYRLGGTEKLWDDWCNEMAKRYPKAFANGDEVSRLHLVCLGLD